MICLLYMYVCIDMCHSNKLLLLLLLDIFATYFHDFCNIIFTKKITKNTHEYIRILHECQRWIDKSVMRVALASPGSPLDANL